MRLDDVGQDVRIAWRGFAKQPVAVTVAVLSLAGSIGITTATLTIRNAVFYNPPPLYQNTERLSRIRISTPQQRRGPVPGRLYAAWITDAAPRDTFAAATEQQPVDLRTADTMTPARVRRVTSGLFSLLGVEAALGRTFSRDEPAGSAPPVVLSHQVWRNVFGGRSDVVGSTVWLDEKPHVVIGVMPERFWFRAMLPEIWTLLPDEALPGADLDVVGRRPTNVSVDSLAHRLQASATAFAASLPESTRQLRVLVSAVRGTPIGEEVALIVPALVGTAVLLTLIIACANVAILMFARWTAREHEIAIRSSLGASRGRLVSLLLTESTLIAMSPLMGMALLLTATGIFGVLAFAVSRRAKELAVRVAIGASPVDVLRLITAHSLTLTLTGGFLGVAVTFVLTRVVRAAGGAGSAYDTPSWPAFAMPVLIVTAASALASWIPARRALRIDPAQLLRAE